MSLLVVGSLIALAAAAAAWLLRQPPNVPAALPTWPSLGFLYLQIIRSALLRKKAPTNLQGKPIQVKLSGPVRMDDSRYAAFLKLIGLQSIPSQVPLSYPFVEAFRLSMLAMSHKDFPFNVLGAVLARNSSIFMRPLHADEALTFSAQVDPNYHKNEKGDFEIQIVGTATDGSGAEVWHNSLTVVVINPKRQRGGGNKPTAPGQAAVESQKVLAQLLIPGNAGRAYGALSGDRNPIHLHSLTSQLFGFKRPIAHAMYLVARLEAELSNAGYAPKQFPAVFETEFKRPTPLPAKLQAVVRPAAQPQLQCAVLTGDGAKEVVVGRLYSR